MNEIRNELLLIRNLMKSDEKEKQFHIEWLLDRFESDIKRQLSDIEYRKKDLEDNLETLKFVREELNIKQK